jgi:glycerol-3-phosphate dehydrogenase
MPAASPAAPSFSGIVPGSRTAAAVDHYVRNEWAIHLDDILIRRSGWSTYDQLDDDAVEQIANWMATSASWSKTRRDTEIADYRARSHVTPATQGERRG